MVRSLWSEGDRKPVSSAGDQGGGGGAPRVHRPLRRHDVQSGAASLIVRSSPRSRSGSRDRSPAGPGDLRNGGSTSRPPDRDGVGRVRVPYRGASRMWRSRCARPHPDTPAAAGPGADVHDRLRLVQGPCHRRLEAWIGAPKDSVADTDLVLKLRHPPTRCADQAGMNIGTGGPPSVGLKTARTRSPIRMATGSQATMLVIIGTPASSVS